VQPARRTPARSSSPLPAPMQAFQLHDLCTAHLPQLSGLARRTESGGGIGERILPLVLPAALPVAILTCGQPWLSAGGPAGIRTLDPKIKSLVLYQLSYRPTVPGTRDPAHLRKVRRLLPPLARLVQTRA
jgi:hypothetical protein